jgi:surface carbohydrate biosynthesis protein (TIGR04326 family)
LNSILIWDGESSPPAHVGTIVLWRAFTEDSSSDCFSIPQFVEENADALRSCYLAWIYELGEMRFKGRRLIDHLQLRPGFSYWWMTLLAENCNYSKSPQIDDAIRMLAFTAWAAGRPLERITLVSANPPLAACLRGWCIKNGVAFEWQHLPRPAKPKSWVRRAYASLPHAVQALVWLLKYLLERWPLRGRGLQAWRQAKGEVTFFTYSDNCIPEAIQQGDYASRYWAHLPDVLKREEYKTNWLHLYVKDNVLPSATRAATVVDAFNNTEQGLQCHVTLDTFISLSVILRTLWDSFRLIKTGMRLGSDLHHAQPTSPELWPLLRADWLSSLYGAVAMNNLLVLNLFEASLKSLPKQRQGVYLQENISWEFGLLNAWRAAGHGHLIGTPHSTIRFWDLRYFFDPRSYVRTGGNDLPMPNQVACNGPVARSTYQQGGYPVQDLVDVEALRYLHLGKPETAKGSVPRIIGKPARLLVLGDSQHVNTRLQMRLLEQAAPLITQQLKITVKPHPNCPIEPNSFPALNLQISMEPIAILLAECDMAYASALTSAAVDAYCAGVPTVSVLDPNTLNLSPLRGCNGALFASTPNELAAALVTLSGGYSVPNKQLAYFTVDGKLPNWRGLIM